MYGDGASSVKEWWILSHVAKKGSREEEVEREQTREMAQDKEGVRKIEKEMLKSPILCFCLIN